MPLVRSLLFIASSAWLCVVGQEEIAAFGEREGVTIPLENAGKGDFASQLRQTLQAEKAKFEALQGTPPHERARGCRRIFVKQAGEKKASAKSMVRAAEASCAGFITLLDTGRADLAHKKQVAANWAHYADGIARKDFDGIAFAPTVFFTSSSEEASFCLKLAANLVGLSLFCIQDQSATLAAHVHMAVTELGIPVLVASLQLLFLRSPGLRLIHDGRTVQYPQASSELAIFFPGKHIGKGFFSTAKAPVIEAVTAWASGPSAFFEETRAQTKDSADEQKQKLKTPWQIHRPGRYPTVLLPEFEYRPSRHAAKRGHSDYLDEFDEEGKVRPYRERNGHHIEQMIQAVAYLFTESTAERAIESMQQTGMWHAGKLLSHTAADVPLTQEETTELTTLLNQLYSTRASMTNLRISDPGELQTKTESCRRILLRDQKEAETQGLSNEEAQLRTVLIEAARKSCHGFIQMVIASKPSVCYLDNYLYFANGLAASTAASAQFAGHPPLVVMVGDKLTMTACNKLRTHYDALQFDCVKHIHYSDEFVPVEWGSDSYKRLMWTKPGLMKLAVDAGIPVLMSDIDIIQYKNPMHFLLHDGKTVQTGCEDEGLVKVNAGYIFLPGEHVGGGQWSTTAPIRAFVAKWNTSMDAVWTEEFFELYKGRGFGNPQNEQMSLYRMHFRAVTERRPELRPASWGDMAEADDEHRVPRIFKNYDLAQPWAFYTMAPELGVEWRPLPPQKVAFSNTGSPAEELVMMHFISVGSKIKAMKERGVWQAQLFADPKKWCSYDYDAGQ